MRKDRYSEEELAAMADDIPIWAREDLTKNFQWRIIDLEKAKELRVELIELTEGRALLSIDAAHIPSGMSFEDYLKFLVKTGVVINDSSNKNAEK